VSTTRLRELCDAVENGSARQEDVRELARLAREAANDQRDYVVKHGPSLYMIPSHPGPRHDNTFVQYCGRMSKRRAKAFLRELLAKGPWVEEPRIFRVCRKP
jgi:hypothetical protein